MPASHFFHGTMERKMTSKKSHGKRPGRSRFSLASRLLGSSVRDTLQSAQLEEPRRNTKPTEKYKGRKHR